MKQLRSMGKAIHIYQPKKRLKDLVLSRDVEIIVRGFIREWGFADVLTAYELQPRSTMLLHGASGNGKTALAEAIAGELGLPFGLVQQSELVGMYKGETAKTMADMFRCIEEAQCLICFDECDFLISARTYEKRGNWEREANNIVNEFLMQMDRLQNGSLIAFTTNFNGALDPAAARRIAVKIEIPNPTPEALEAHSQLLLKKWPFLSQREDWWKHTTSKSFAEHEETMRSAARRMIVEGMVKKPP